MLERTCAIAAAHRVGERKESSKPARDGAESYVIRVDLSESQQGMRVFAIYSLWRWNAAFAFAQSTGCAPRAAA